VGAPPCSPVAPPRQELALGSRRDLDLGGRRQGEAGGRLASSSGLPDGALWLTSSWGKNGVEGSEPAGAVWRAKSRRGGRSGCGRRRGSRSGPPRNSAGDIQSREAEIFFLFFKSGILQRTFLWLKNKILGRFAKCNLMLGFHLPHRFDRWGHLVRNRINLLNRHNQCYLSQLYLKSGIYVSKNLKVIVIRHQWRISGRFLSFSPHLLT
jgi:hypothetical protein